ncbi:MAG: hypothetical protein HY815_24830 [Candidatus Riflebacteria bacterium]|nr:hypothetical protein [Candidatus Riflebacteria bacterium]
MAQEKLFELHSLDLTLLDLDRQTAAQKKRLVTHRENTLLRQKRRDQLKDQHKTLQVEVKQLELSIEQAKQRKSALGHKVERVINVRELEALTKEITGLGVEIEAREETLLGLYERSEKLDQELASLEADLQRRGGELSRLEVDVAAQVKLLAETAATARQARTLVEAQVEPALLARYSRARTKYEGAVLFAIRDNSCEGCGLSAPGYEWNRIRQNPGNVYDCSNCGRLLVYVGEAL